MSNEARFIAIVIVSVLLFFTGIMYIITKAPDKTDKHLYGSTCIDTTCWNKNDQLHYILKETRLELKQCNFLTQELADSIKNLHALYGEWILEYEQELEQIGYYNGDNDILSKYNSDDNKPAIRIYYNKSPNNKFTIDTVTDDN